jgi:hypothetical protein
MKAPAKPAQSDDRLSGSAFVMRLRVDARRFALTHFAVHPTSGFH